MNKDGGVDAEGEPAPRTHPNNGDVMDVGMQTDARTVDRGAMGTTSCPPSSLPISFWPRDIEYISRSPSST